MRRGPGRPAEGSSLRRYVLAPGNRVARATAIYTRLAKPLKRFSVSHIFRQKIESLLDELHIAQFVPVLRLGL